MTVTNTGTVTSDEVVQVYGTIFLISNSPMVYLGIGISSLSTVSERFSIGFLKTASLPDATVPAPRVRLVAYQRVRAIAPSESVLITLTVRPDSHAVVLDDGSSVYVADVVVQGGRLHLSVGGGQPSPHGRTVSATVAVSTSSLVRSC